MVTVTKLYVAKRIMARIAVFCVLGLIFPMITFAQTPPSSGTQNGNGTPTAEDAKLRSYCQNNLKQFGLVMKMYANESKGMFYPPFSSEAGKLMVEAKVIVPEYVTDPNIFYCPAFTNKKPIEKPVVNADSYLYLGYVLRGDEDVEQFAKYYKEHAKKGGAYDETILSGNTDPKISMSEKLPFLREGIERFYITDINDPSASAKVQSSIPVMMDWPDNHKNPDGGSVLYMDGHVEFIKYPGKWPMTEKTMKILCELAGRPPIGKRNK